MKKKYLFFWTFLFLVKSSFFCKAQNFGFSGGPILMCDTSYFTANVSNIGLIDPNGSPGTFSLTNICIDISTNHPQTLVISLTSPSGSTLLLSAFNGAGGSNYTNCCFDHWSSSITTGSAPFTGSWSPQGGNLNVFDWQIADGTWTITVIDTSCQPGGGGLGWSNGYFNGNTAGGISFSQAPPPICTGWIPNGSTNICQGDTVNLLSFYNAPFYSYTFYLAGNIVANPAVVTVAGTYDVWGFDIFSGCSYNATYTISFYSNPALGPDQSVTKCAGIPENLNGLFPLSNLTALWSLNGSSITAGMASAATTTGTYQVIALNPGGCGGADTAIVTLNFVTSISLGPDLTQGVCSGSNLNLYPLFNTTGFSTSWTINGSAVFNPAFVSASGTYVLIASLGGNCIDTAQVTVNNLPSPALGPNKSTSPCAGNSIDLNNFFITLGLNTAWTTLSGAPVANPASVNTAGIYKLTATDSNGCSDIAYLTVNMLPLPSLGPDKNVSICANSTSNLNLQFNLTGINSANWTNNGTAVINPSSVNSAGIYTLIASASNSCVDTANVILSLLAVPALGADQLQNICANTSFDLTGLYTTTGLTANWTNNGTTVVNPFAVNSAGTYTLVAISSNSCSDTSDFVLSVLSAPVLGADQSQNICANTSLNLTGLFSTTGLNVNWTNNGSPVVNPSSVNSAGTYTLVASSSSGCTDTANVVLAVLTAPLLGADQSQNICANTSFDLTGLYTTTGLTANWTNNGTQVINPSSVNSAGTYTLIASASNSCVDTSNVIINLLAVPALGADQSQNICSNNSLDLTVLFNTIGLTASWINNGSAVINPTAVNSAGTYTLVVSSSSGCTDTANVVLSVLSAPVLGADQSQSICANTSLDLTGLYSTTSLNVNWTNNGTTVVNPSSVNSAGTYTLIASMLNGCNDTASVMLNVNPLPVLGSYLFQNLCPGNTLDLSNLYNLTGLNVSYTLNGATVANFTAVFDSGIYIINVSDAKGCANQAMVTVTNSPCICRADFIYSAKCLQYPVNFNLISDSAVLSAHWTFENNILPEEYLINPIVKFPNEEKIMVTLEASLSCGDVIVQKIVQVEDCSESCHFFLPGAFSPNDDGRNDQFTWYGDCVPEEFEMDIRNRFGQQLFHTSNPNVSWDGRYENRNLPSGVYVFHVTYKLPYQKNQNLSGKITIVR